MTSKEENVKNSNLPKCAIENAYVKKPTGRKDGSCLNDSSDDDVFMPKKKTKRQLSPNKSSNLHADELVCSFCFTKFSSKENLTRHSRACVKNPEKVSLHFECHRCKVSFSRKDNLKIHVQKCYPDQINKGCGEDANTTSAVCNFCSNTFACIKTLKRHELSCLKNSDRDSSTHDCPNCQAKFSRKDNLSYHLKKCSTSERGTEKSDSPVQDYACSHCSKKFSSKSNASRHEKNCPMNSSTIENFQCSACGVSFNRKDNLSLHEKKCSGCVPKKKTVPCLHKNCDFVCWTKKVLIDHLKSSHDSVIAPVVNKKFKSESEFIEWKEEEEARTYSYYSQDCGLKGNRLYLYCQHDGSDRPHRKADSAGRKTSRKSNIGQIKRGIVCISKIVVLIHKDDSRDVEYYASHSHPLSKHDLAHQPLSQSTNALINSQLAANVPVRDIYNSLQSSSSARENRDLVTTSTRNVIITERLIRQRAARKRASLRFHQNDAVSVRLLVESLTQEKYNPVVVYKPMGEQVIVGPEPKEKFCDDDLKNLFLLGLQTKEQRKLMVQYSFKVLIVDDTHNVTQYENVKLFNMLIADENNRGWPVGHLISNCMAAKIVKIFVHAVKIRCEEAEEVLSINCVISDDDPALINGIEEGVGESLRHILCQWHLDKTFQEQIRMKASRDLYDTIYSELKVIIAEKNKATFSAFCDAFLKNHSVDAPDFVAYLEKYYSQRIEKWAMSHREGLGHGNINTTAHAESFHNRLKTGQFKRIPNKRMDDLVNTLLALDRLDFQARERIDILGYSAPPNKRKEKHEMGIAMPDSSLETVREGLWQIESATVKNQVYHITRMQDFCRKDHCFDRCVSASCHGLCIHLFLCSCGDDVPLCKHIHKLQSFLLRDSPAPACEDDYNGTSDVRFYSVENNVPALTQVTHQNEFSEANAYSRLEVNLRALSNLVSGRSISKNLLPMCDTTISDLVKKLALLSIPVCESSCAMPQSRKIAPKEKLATQYSQMLPFKRRKKRAKQANEAKGSDIMSVKTKRDSARETLLESIRKSEGEIEWFEIESEEDEPCTENMNAQDSSPSLSDIALFIGPYRVSFLALKTLPLDINETEVEELKTLDPTFNKGWLTSDVINAFLYSLALTNESVYSGADELALSMARGNTLTRLFYEELPGKTIFLFPANFSGNHWTMFAVLSEKSQILYMDPRPGQKSPSVLKCINTIKQVMSVVKPSILCWTDINVDYCNQIDSVNCGVHVCWFAHQTIMNSDYSDLDNVIAYRKFIYETIRGNCLQFVNNLNACIICSSEDSQSSSSDITLQCEKCCQRYHLSCLGCKAEDVLKEDFVCPELVAF